MNKHPLTGVFIKWAGFLFLLAPLLPLNAYANIQSNAETFSSLNPSTEDTVAQQGQGFHIPESELSQPKPKSSRPSTIHPEPKKIQLQLEKKMPKLEDMTPTPSAPMTPPPPPVHTFTPPPSSLDMPVYVEDEEPFADDIAELHDPLEGYNRFMHRVNTGIYDYFMEPVARAYKKVVHEKIRLSIRNVFDNALSPVKFVSSLAQGDVDKSARVLSRMMINTTVGLGGLFDVAKHYEVENVSEDFGQALGYHGVPPGPYVVLPFLGPSTMRDTVGGVVDSFLSPTIVVAPGFAVGTAINMTNQINRTSFLVDDLDQLDKDSIDDYEQKRDVYHQYREQQIKE